VANCSAPLTGLIPINDLGAGQYLGFQGGYYPNGMNRLPLAHDGAGRRMADEVKAALDAGQPCAFAGLGFSGAQRVWNQFVPLWNAHPYTNKNVRLPNLCLAGVNSDDLANPASSYWTTHVPTTLAAAGIALADVRVVWVETGYPPPPSAFPGHAQAMQANLVAAAQNIRTFFPNCRLAYLTSSHYHGYANQAGQEPFAYEHAFGVKWAIEQQINGDPALAFAGPSAVAPWLGWAGYPWCDGASPRASDGLAMTCPADFATDGQHPSTAGANKLASVLLNDLLDDWTAKTWMLNLPTGGGTGTPPPMTQTP